MNLGRLVYVTWFTKLFLKCWQIGLSIFLPHIISPEQSAFIPGRFITDNILVAFKTLHTMDTRLKGKEGFMAMKLDMSKAYDRIEWNFVEGVLRKIGFANRWISLLMSCIWTVTYSILINGQPHGLITPSRGLCQGDPLSSYLFILCAEVLSSWLQHYSKEGLISGVPLSCGGTRIHHLFFADDCLLFSPANLKEWSHIQTILGIYEAASGQQVNREKTAIFFSRNTREVDRQSILQGMDASPTTQYEKYLGHPALIGRSRISTFNGLK